MDYQPNMDMINFSEKVVKKIQEKIKSDQDKAIFDMIFLQNLKYEETAQQLNIPIGTVKTVVHKIRKIAVQKFGREYQEII